MSPLPVLGVEIEPQPQRQVSVLRQAVTAEQGTQGIGLNVGFDQQEVLSANLHVFSLRLEGRIGMRVRNTGRAPLVNGQVQEWRTDFESRTLHKSRHRVGFLRAGGSDQVESGWEVLGPLDVLWELVRILFTGTAKVQQRIMFHALGYHKDWRAEMRIPVRSVTVRWD